MQKQTHLQHFLEHLIMLQALVLSVFLGAVIPVQAQQPCGTPQETPLLAGQTMPVGTVTAYNDESTLYITYRTIETWQMTETHLDVAANPADLKQTKKGNPIPGQFPYKSQHEPGVFEQTYAVDISQWPAETPLYIAAHAVVVSSNGSETAWAAGTPFPGSNWATYFSYTLQPCEAPPANPGVISFSDPQISVQENGVSVTVTLQRQEGSDGQVSVDVTAADMTATMDEDYAFSTITVFFEEGETSKEVEVFILDDQLDEPDEQLQLNLTNPVGAEIGDQRNATVTIVDDDEETPQ